MIRLLIGLALAAAGGPPAADGLATVPGVGNPAVTQANIAQTVCEPGWSAVQRKLLGSHADVLKKKLMAAAGIPWSESGKYELDHDWSIENGGSPTDPNNLWLQPYFGPRNAHQKDAVEDRLHKLLCSAQITLEQDGKELTSDWVASYRARIGPLP